MEAFGYKTKVFEFISTEHTPKNVLIVGIKAKVDDKKRKKNKRKKEVLMSVISGFSSGSCVVCCITWFSNRTPPVMFSLLDIGIDVPTYAAFSSLKFS